MSAHAIPPTSGPGRTTRALALAAALAFCQAPAGCGKAETESGATPRAQPGGVPSLTAVPNPVPAGSGKFGTTTITWDTGTGAPGDVYVSDNGGAEKPFQLKRARGSKEVTWIGNGVYVFRLYGGQDRKQVLAEVQVTRGKK
jgi:hypothetical protein